MKISRYDKVFNTINAAFLVLFCLVIIYPFINTLAISLNSGHDAARGGITFFPRVFTLANYKLVFESPNLLSAYKVTILRTVIGTVTSVFCTALFAYGLSYKKLVGKKLYTWICLIAMYFSGGLIPYFFLIKGLGLLDNFLVYIIPGLIGVWNMIIMRTFFTTLPDALEESAKLDGAGDFRTFFSIILPLSKPILVTIILFNGVNHWNAWFDANIFIQSQELMPVQTVLMQVLNSSSISNSLAANDGILKLMRTKYSSINSSTIQTIRAATMIVTTVPIMLIYPFLQKYFVKGVMIGSLKG